jgi:hypothetical protein
VRALLRRHRGLQRKRKQAQQRQVWVWKPNHGLHPDVEQAPDLMFMRTLVLLLAQVAAAPECLVQQPLVPGEAPLPAESMSPAAPAAGGAGLRFTYQSLSKATNNFEKRAAEGVGQSLKECWRWGRVLL